MSEKSDGLQHQPSDATEGGLLRQEGVSELLHNSWICPTRAKHDTTAVVVLPRASTRRSIMTEILVFFLSLCLN